MTDTLRELRELTTATEAQRETQRLMHSQFGLSPDSDQDLAREMLRELQIDLEAEMPSNLDLILLDAEATEELRKDLQDGFIAWWDQYAAQRPVLTHQYPDGKGSWNVRQAPSEYVAQKVFGLYVTLRLNRWGRDTITELALEASLCPLHFVDYAICFDDEDPECSQIRVIHPSHDT
jgi:hypothetical protein